MAESIDAVMTSEIKAAKETAKKAYVANANRDLSKYSGGDAWQYPIAAALMEMMVASLVAQEPSYIAMPLNADGEMILPVMEKILTHYSHMLDMRTRAEEAADWVCKTGLAVGKVGYAEEGGDSSSTILGQFWLDTLDSRRFWADPMCVKNDLSDARFCGDTVSLPKIEALNSSLYNPEVIDSIQPRVSTAYDEGKSPVKEQQVPSEYALIELDELHYRDYETKGIKVGSYCVETNDPAREMKPLPESWRHFNYIPLVIFPVPGRFYGQSMTAKVRAICDSLDAIFKRIDSRWEHAPEKVIGNKALLGETGIYALKSEEMWDFVEIQDGSVREAVDTLHGQSIYADEQNYIQFLLQMFQYISGMTDMQLGRGSSSTATEAGLIKQSADMRSARRMSIMERWVATIGQRLWTMARWAFRRGVLPAEEILGPQLTQVWQAYEEKQSEREKIMQDTDIVVRMSMPMNAAAVHRRDKNLEFLRSVSSPDMIQIMMSMGKMPNFPELISNVARDSGLGENAIVDFTPPQEAQAQEAQ